MKSLRDGSTATAASAIASGVQWQQAFGAAVGELGDTLTSAPDLALMFAHPAYASAFPHMVAEIAERTGARVVVGCSGHGVIGMGREVEHQAAVATMAAALPGADLHAIHLTQAQIAATPATPDDWERLTGVDPLRVNAWLILADPFTLDAEALLAGLALGYPGVPLVGGMASGDPRGRQTHLFLNGSVVSEGAVLVAIGGGYTVQTVVSQGTEPIGEPWTVTGARANVLESIGYRPPYEVLMETFQALTPEMQARARTNLLMGVAISEYRDEFKRGDYLIRNLVGLDEGTGAIAISDHPRIGQTVQFQVRDAGAADAELREMLAKAHADLRGVQPLAAMLFACNGRGTGLFHEPDHDARVLAETLGPLPTAGFFCNGEIGPVGGRPFVHGFTASIGLIVPAPPREPDDERVPGPGVFV